MRDGYLHGMLRHHGQPAYLACSVQTRWLPDGYGDRLRMIRCDVLVVGAGPAGIAAASVAAESRCRVCLVDDNAAAGGQIWRGYGAGAEGQAHGGTFALWRQRMTKANIEFRFGARVVAQPGSGVLRVESDDCCTDIRYERLILATGARERFLPFPGWTLPGVMGTGGLQAMVKSGLPIAGEACVGGWKRATAACSSHGTGRAPERISRGSSSRHRCVP